MTKLQVAIMSYLFLAFCFVATASLADQPDLGFILHDDSGYEDCATPKPQSENKASHIEASGEEALFLLDAHSAVGTSIIHPFCDHIETPPLTKEVEQEPIQSVSNIFDGKSLDNWSLENGKPVPSGWEVNNGTIHRKRGKKRFGNIVTRELYGDFEFSFEWKIAKGGNSGVKYRVQKYGRKMLGYEYQILDTGKTNQPPSKKDTGSIYALFEPSPDRTLNPAGQFNTSRIIAQGNHIEHWLNGKLIASATIGSDEWQKRVAESKFNDVPDFGRNAKGRIMLTDHGAEVWYRNLKISSPPATGESNAATPK